jgi:hypothetical protein
MEERFELLAHKIHGARDGPGEWKREMIETMGDRGEGRAGAHAK